MIDYFFVAVGNSFVFYSGTGETPSIGTLDSYLSRLSSALESRPHEHRALVLKLQELLPHLDR